MITYRTLFRRLIFMIMLVVLFIPGAVVLQQDENPLPPGAPDTSLPQQTLTGWLNVLHGDPHPGSEQSYRQVVALADAQGQMLAEISLNPDTAQRYLGQEVQVVGRVLSVSGIMSAVPNLAAEIIQPVSQKDEMPFLASPKTAVTGSQPWVNILCKFPDIPGAPHVPSWYPPLFNSSYPGLDHYWQQASYGNMNLSGSATPQQWFTLPNAYATYFNANGSARLDLLAKDCTHVADSAVNFPSFVGINIMLNEVLDCCAWGGGWNLTLDGQTKTYRMTWLPPWAQGYGVMAHEMGHGFGFPHSTGPADDPPSGLSVYVSAWDVMSASCGTGIYGDTDPNGYGCYPAGTIAYHIDKDSWIASDRRASVYPGETTTVTVEQLQLPVSTTNPLLARVLVGGSSQHYYSVEARFGSGYDQNTPADPAYGLVDGAVVIHDVDPVGHASTNGADAHVVDDLEDLSPPGCVLSYALPLPSGCDDLNDDVNDLGSIWQPGETFSDTGNQISISVLSQGTSSFTVQLVNNSPPQLFPDPPTGLIVASVDTNSVTIAWEDNSFNEDGFNIYRWGYCNGSWQFCYYTSVGADVTHFTDPLACGSGNYYEVSAFNSYAESVATPWVQAVSTPCSPPNAAPAPNYWLTDNVTLTWARVIWASGYEVQVDDAAGFPAPPVFTETFDADTFFVTVPSGTLDNGVYYWRVRAQNAAGGWGSWSATQSFTVNKPG